MTMAITTTLNRIRAHSPCLEGWKELLSGLGKTSADDEPLAYSKIAEINGIDDALWCCRAEPQHWKIWHLYAVWCGRQVQHLMTDPRSVAALDVAERHANGLATDEELAAARAAAWAAARAAAWAAARGAAWEAAWDAAWAAAGAAARDAAGGAAWAAAGDAAWAAAGAAARDAAGGAAGGAAWDAAWDAAGDAQKAKFIEMVEAAQ
jgi:hypothetical protein